jgi:hypothetical protein
MAAADRQEEELSFYERLLAEAAQAEEKENPEREKRQERMRAYVRSRRKAMCGGGYVTFEEIQGEQERYLADLQTLRNLMVNRGTGPNEGYRLAYLRRKYPTEYTHLRDIEISSK